MWVEKGNFQVEHHPWGDTKSIDYIYEQSGLHSTVTKVLLDAGVDFFRITLMCASTQKRQNLIQKLQEKQFGPINLLSALDLFFKSGEVSKLMEFMDIIQEIEPKVVVLKEKITERCKSGFIPTPPAKLCVEARELPKGGTTILSLEGKNDKPYFADLQEQFPGRRRSSLVKPS